MANHLLSLEIPDILTSCVLRIMDTSAYNPDLNVKCGQLQIMAPGFSTGQFIDNVYPNFTLNLTSCDLKIQKTNCGKDFNSLPDGLYVVKWSVSPNDVVYVEYNHLRITKALNTILNIYCDIDLGVCEPSSSSRAKLEKLRLIQDYLKAAKAQVEYCRQSKKGLELYKEAMKMLDKINCKNCY